MSCTIMPCLIAVKQRKMIKTNKRMRANSRFYRTYQTHWTEGLDKPGKTEKTDYPSMCSLAEVQGMGI